MVLSSITGSTTASVTQERGNALVWGVNLRTDVRTVHEFANLIPTDLKS